MTWTMENVNYPPVPVQFYGHVGRATLYPYRKLWLAVMNEAYDNLHGVCPGEDGWAKKMQIRRDAVRWFLSPRTAPGSFLWVCREVLEVSPWKILDVMRGRGLLGQDIPEKRRRYRRCVGS